MWGFHQKPAASAISQKVAFALAKERGLTGEAAASLRMMERRGRYSGREVTFFRIFDPVDVAAAGINPHEFDDNHTNAMLFRGHVERNGQIVVTQQLDMVP